MKQISFTQEVKEEICSQEYKIDEMKALLSGFVKVNGTISFSNRLPKIILKTENAKIAKLIFKCFQQVFMVSPLFTYSRKMNLDKATIFYIEVQEKSQDILKELEVMDGFFPIYPQEIILKEQLRFFIAGAFLASGSVNSPQSGNYHLQMIVSEEEDAKYFLKILNRFRNERKMEFKMIPRRKKYVVYLKKADQIAMFLTIVGASLMMLEFENSRIEKDYLNSENRFQICLTANYQKTMQASTQQISDIKVIDEKLGRKNCEPKLQALMSLREQHPEAPLQELANLMIENYQIPISKSGVNHLLKTINKLALKLQGK